MDCARTDTFYCKKSSLSIVLLLLCSIINIRSSLVKARCKILFLMYVFYSYVRAEVMAGFINALFLMFVGFFIFSEAVEVCNGYQNIKYFIALYEILHDSNVSCQFCSGILYKVAFCVMSTMSALANSIVMRFCF